MVPALALAAKLPRLTFHGLRHTHVTAGLTAGIHPKIVSERLGDSSIGITLDTYSHLLPSMDEEAAETMAKLLEDPERPEGKAL
jgi:integrase